MAPLKHEVNIGLEAYLGVLQGKTLDDLPYLPEARAAVFDNLVWRAQALKVARSAAAQNKAA